MNNSLSNSSIMLEIKEQWRQWATIYKNKKVALYGAGEHSLFLEKLLASDFYQMPICCFIDSSPNGKELLNIPVMSRVDCEFSAFDFVIISSKSAENEIYQSLLIELPAEKIGRFYKRDIKDIFDDIYKENHWGDENSISGPGSVAQQTKIVVNALPKIFRQLNIRSMLDIPCGDYNWMQHVEKTNIKYIGGDIVEDVIIENKKKFRHVDVSFHWLDLLSSSLPKVDVIFCRDCLVHFSFADVDKALHNIVKSGAKYFISTTFITQTINQDISTGGWRPLNLRIAPFNLPEPMSTLIEKCTENNGKYSDKALGIWKVHDINYYLKREKA